MGRGARSLLQAPDGGTLLLVDESYNANPASVRAALAALDMVPRADHPRRIAVLGDMLELGDSSADRHHALKEAVDAAGIDLVFACGPMMKLLYDSLESNKQGAWAENSQKLVEPFVSARQSGDVVMIKASNGSRMGPVVAALQRRFAAPRAAGE